MFVLAHFRSLSVIAMSTFEEVAINKLLWMGLPGFMMENAYMITMMNVRDESVSVWMDAVPANTRSALSFAQLSPL